MKPSKMTSKLVKIESLRLRLPRSLNTRVRFLAMTSKERLRLPRSLNTYVRSLAMTIKKEMLS